MNLNLKNISIILLIGIVLNGLLSVFTYSAVLGMTVLIVTLISLEIVNLMDLKNKRDIEFKEKELIDNKFKKEILEKYDELNRRVNNLSTAKAFTRN